MPQITTMPDGATFSCAAGDTVLRAALRAGLGMPYSCNVGSCGNCRFELLAGEVSHLRSDPPAWSERDAKRNRWLGCQALPNGDCTIKFRADPASVSQHRPAVRSGRLSSVTPVTRDISEFTFEIDGDDGFLPGQYALLNAPGVDGGRPYSMSNLPGTGQWSFLIKRMPGGAATGHLFDHATIGDNVKFDGPYGTAWLRQGAPRDILLMAGGSGLSPMLSIARGALTAGLQEQRKIHFYYGGRDLGDLPGVGTLADLAPIPIISALSEPAAGGGWTGPTGFLHDVVQSDLGDRLAAHEVYFAGPAVMSGAVQKMTQEAKVPVDQLHFDEFY